MIIVLTAFLLFSQTACSLIDRLGASRAALSDPSVADSDGDSVSDEIERQIGTNPHSRNDDIDNDGVPNYLEYSGYTYDWKTGKFAPWDGDPAVRHWRTDPIQWSTDQDPFPDGMEASGALMDVTVQEPGDDPLVPAYPNIVVRLESYAVTLNEDISYTDGGSLAKGSTWNRQTTQTSSRSMAHQWEVGLSVTQKLGFKAGPAAPTEASTELTVHAKYGQTRTSTQTTSTAVSVGNSVLDTSNWARARASNPTRAAHLKLRLKVHNYGTACASNIIPTMTLRIGGINVATFQPGNTQINILPPGGQYPSGRGVYWVVDSIDTGAGVTPLYLTLDELRALERGAPVSLSVTQLKADVMLKNRSGDWTNAGDCSEYLTRCEAVGANIHIEIGDGSFVHHLVYADDAPSAPRVTLRDALTSLGVRPDGQVDYWDTEGIAKVASIDGYTFVFDQETLLKNGWDMNVQPPSVPAGEFNMAHMVLGPGTSVLIRAPRKSLEKGPTIHYASADPRTRVVQACVSDYDGINSVQLLDKEGESFVDNANVPLFMSEDIPGSGFFSFVVPPSHYVFDGTEKVIATNVAEQDANQPVEIVYYEPTPRPERPVFEAVGFRYQAGKPQLYANVTNSNPTFPIKWVKAFSPYLDKGVKEMTEPSNAYEDPNGWTVELDPGSEDLGDLKVVAYVQPGVYEEAVVSAPNDIVLGEFKTVLKSTFDYGTAIKSDDKWETGGLDLDKLDKSRKYSNWNEAVTKFTENYELTSWCTKASHDQWMLNFTIPFVKVDPKMQSFDSIRKKYVEYLLGATGSNRPDDPGDYAYKKNDIFVFITSEGRYAKLQITGWDDTNPGWKHRRYLYLHFVVYSSDEEEDQTESEKGP